MRGRWRFAAVAAAVLLAIVLLAALRSQGPGGSHYNAAVLADHPVAFWNMQASSAIEPDLTANGHTGSYQGGSPAHGSLPDGEQAAAFNGTGQYLTVPSSPSFSISSTGELTWEAWIKPQTLQFSSASDRSGFGYVSWMGKCQHYSPNCEWQARMYSSSNREGRCNRLSAYVFNPSAGLGAGAGWQPTCNLFAAGQWLHVVGEYQTKSTPSRCSSSYPGTIDIWVNGVKWNPSYHPKTGCMSQYAITPQARDSPLDIGTMALDSFFPGAIGKVAIYDKLLSQTQISAHFTAMTGTRPSGTCTSSCVVPLPTP